MSTDDPFLSPSAAGEETAPDPYESAVRRPSISFDRYVLLEELGAGGMGRVFAAWDRQLARRIALKILRRGMGPARVLREAQALAMLKHENVVTVYDAGEAQGETFIAMELIEGRSLRRWLLGGGLRWQQVLRVLVAAGRGLAAAHRKGLVHRDFKPDNVLVGDDGSVRVVDFGLARLLDDAPLDGPPDGGTLEPISSITRTGHAAGTPRYMAPEQSAGRGAGPAADQYAFAVTAIEALTGEHPVIHDRPYAVPAGKLPSRIRAVLQRAMTASPADRWPDLDELLAELQRRRPARRIALAGGALLALGLAAAGWHQAGAPERACEAAVARLDLGWGDRERAALAGAFAATGANGAAAAAGSAIRALDRYAADLRAMSADVCRAARVDGRQSEATYQLRTACLGRKARGLEVLVGELGNPDARIVGRAGEAAHSLSPIAECADVEALAAPTSVPADPALRAGAAVLDRQLAELDALGAAGRSRLFLVRSAALVPLARLVGFQPLVAEALLGFEAARDRASGRTDTTGMLEEALLTAEATGDDARFVRAAAKLVGRCADAGKIDDGRRWARLGEAALARMGPSPASERLRATLELSESSLADNNGDFYGAAAHAARGVALLSRLAPQSRVLYRGLWALARARLALGRPADAAADLVRALGLAAELALPPTDVATLWSLLGTAALRQKRPVEACEAYRRGLQLVDEAGDHDARMAAVLLENRANALQQLGDFDAALLDLRRAADIAAARGDPGELRGVLVDQAGLEERRFRWQPARELLLRALAVDSPDVDRRIVLAALARVESELGLVADARAHADRAVAIAERLDPASAEAAHAFEAAAIAYAAEPRRCLPLLRRARPGLERRYGPRSVAVTELLSRIGVAQLAAGDAAAARSSLEEAWAMAPADLLPDGKLALARIDPGAARARALAAEARAAFAERRDARGEAQATQLLARLRDPD